MNRDREHTALLRLVSKITEIPSVYSRDELAELEYHIEKYFPRLRPILREYIHLAEDSRTHVHDKLGSTAKRAYFRANWGQRPQSGPEAHLFDLLRSKDLFSTNSELAEFAGRILPDMTKKRFDKMSRGDIAARIIEFLEANNPENRKTLENAMRSALRSIDYSQGPGGNKESFFRQWEQIIRGKPIR